MNGILIFAFFENYSIYTSIPVVTKFRGASTIHTLDLYHLSTPEKADSVCHLSFKFGIIVGKN